MIKNSTFQTFTTKPLSVGLRLQTILLSLFVCGFGSVFVVTALRGHLDINPMRIILLLALCVFFFLLQQRVFPHLDKLSRHSWNLLFYGGLTLLFVLQVCSGFLLLQDLTTSPFDTEAVLRTSTQLAQGIIPAEYNDYFSCMDSNVFCMFVFYWLYRPVYLITGSTAPHWAMLLNTVFLFVAAFAVCHTAKTLWGRRGGLSALVVCLFFLPYYIFTSFVYTDTLAAPFVACSIWVFTLLCKHWSAMKTAPRVLSVFGLGALVGFGFLAKGNVMLLYPAFGLYLLVRYNVVQLFRAHWKTVLCTLAAFLLGSGIAVNGFNVYKQTCGLLNYELYESVHIPVSHWIMMGLEHNGAFHQESFQYTAQYPTIAEKKEAIAARIQSNLTHLLQSPKSLVWLMYTKAETNWMHGLFTAPVMANFSPVQRTWLSEWFVSDGAHLDITENFGQAFYWLIWGAAFWAAVRSIRQPTWRGAPLTLLCAICLLGNLAFLSLWESNSRYAFCYSCCMLLPLCGILACPKSDT